MIPIDPKKLETAFVRPDTPMLSDVIDKVLSDLGLTPTKRRDIVSGLRRTCEALGLPPQDVPADAAWLQPRVARIMPAALGLRIQRCRAGSYRCGSKCNGSRDDQMRCA